MRYHVHITIAMLIVFFCLMALEIYFVEVGILSPDKQNESIINDFFFRDVQ